MNLKEYLVAKYGPEHHAFMTAAEAKIFGIDYPPTKGWLEPISGLDISPEMRESLITLMTAELILRSSSQRGVYADRILRALGVDVAAISPDGPSRDAAIAIAKSSREEARSRGAARRDARAAAAGKTHKEVLADRKASRAKRRAAARKRSARQGDAAAMRGTYNGTPEQNMRKAERRTQAFVAHSAVDPASDDFLRTSEWAFVRMQALDGFRAAGKFYCHCCMALPEPGAPLHVDHVKPRKFFPELALVVGNLQLLCPTCNKGKGNWSQTDWRSHSATKPT